MAKLTDGKSTRQLTEDWRKKIQVSQIVNRLNKCSLGEVEMTREQIAAAKIILAKALPDLKAIELTGEGGGALVVQIVRYDTKDVDDLK